MRATTRILLIIFLLISHSNSWAKKEILSSGIKTGATLAATSSLVLSSSVTPLSPGNPFFKKAYIDIKFGIFDLQNIYLDRCKAYKIEYNYTTQDIYGNSSGVQTEILEIHYNPDKGKNYNHTAVARKEDAYLIKMVGIKVFVLNSGVPGCSSYQSGLNFDLIYLECVVNTEYYYPMPNPVTLQPNGITTQLNTNCDAKLKVTVPQILEAEEYELEYLWKFSQNQNLSVLTGKYDFAMEATRIQSLSNSFEIPIIYDEGFLLFRYRYIGRNNNNYFNDYVESQWSIDGTDAFGDIANFQGSNYYISTAFPDGHEMNYTFSQSFFGLEMPKSSITYLDGLGRSRQTLTTINTKSGNNAYKSIFQTHEFDYAGRVAVEFMPSPSVEDCFKLQIDQNITTYNYTSFDKEEFDIEPMSNPCSFDPFELETDRITSNSPLFYEHRDAANYYSENNQLSGENAFIPDAFGFPYKQIQYRKDPFNSPSAVGSVGKVFQLGTGHESRMFIGNVSNSELEDLFHGEQAASTYYKKVVNVDPNGQTTFNILDFDGRTVVSGINGQAPKGMDDLVDPTPSSTINNIDLAQDYNEANHVDFTTTISYDQIVAEANTVIEISYDLQGAVFDTSCTEDEVDCQSCINPKNLCFTCLYEMEIKVEDPCGNLVPLQSLGSPQYLGSPQVFITSNPVPQNCQVGFDIDPTLTASFNAAIIGEYHISKILKVSDTPIQDYWDQFVETACCIKPVCEFVDDALGNLNFETCLDECTDCQEVLYRISLPDSDPLSYAYLPATVIANINSHCNTICTTIVNPAISNSICENELKALRFDYYPGGQYATYEIDNAGNFTVSDPLSILNPSCNFNGFNYNVFWTNIGASSWTLEQKITQFDLSWTSSLVQFHPEYKYYEYCVIVDQTGSYNYDAQMLSIETMDEAITLGLIKPISGAQFPSGLCPSGCTQNFDPFFIDPSGQLFSFTEYLNFPYQGFGNIYSLAVQDVEGTGTTVPFGDDVNCNRDLHWKAFRKRYLTAKKWFIGDLRTKFVTENGYINSALGTGLVPPIQTYNPSVSIYSFPFSNAMSAQHFALDCYEQFPTMGLQFLDMPPASCFGGNCGANTESYLCNQLFLPSSGLTWHPNLALKVPHYLGSGQIMANMGISPSNPNSWSSLFAAGAQQAADNCAASCDQMLPIWIDLMDDCQSGYDPQVLNISFQDAVSQATAQMLYICKCACDFEHPNGASNVPAANSFTAPYDPGSPWHFTTIACSSLPYSSFTEVFNHYFPNRDAVSCPNMGVTFPESYDNGNINNLIPQNFLDTCACNTLLSAQQEYNALVVANGNTPPFHFQTLKDFIKVKYYIDLQNIEEIKCYCEKTWNILTANSTWGNTTFWPSNSNSDLALSNYSVPSNISCGTQECISCDSIKSNMESFFDAYLGLPQGTNVLINQITDAYANDQNFESTLLNFFTQLDPIYSVHNSKEIISFYYNCLYRNAIDFDPAHRIPFLATNYCNVVAGQLVSTFLFAPLVDALNELLSNTHLMNSYANTITDVTYPNYFINNWPGANLHNSPAPASFSKYLVNSSSGTLTMPNEPTKIVIITYNNTSGLSSGMRRIFNVILPNDNYLIPNNISLEIINPQFLTPASSSATIYELMTFKCELVLHYNSGDVTIQNVIVETNTYQIAQCTGNNMVFVGDLFRLKQNLFCKSQPTTSLVPPSNCLDAQIFELQNLGQEAWNDYINEAEQEFIFRYKKSCLKGVHEDMSLQLPEKAFAVTLYYYDQADNLVMTIPPEGVNKKTSGINHSRHLLITEYKYDSENKLLASTNPDHLNVYTDYYYSDKSRLMASANPKQKLPANNSFSYTSFDLHERLIEAGESDGLSALQNTVFDYSYLPSDGYEYVLHKLLELQSHKDISHTWYDAYPDANVEAAFLNPSTFYNRNRVTASAFFNSPSNNWTHATNLRSFAYDEHGLVPEQINIMPDLYNQAWSHPISIFRTEYSYNIFSGLMETVTYQRNKHDQFYHRYAYDQDLRLSFVYTSKNAVVWDQDARYIYYPHGPLARTELGHDKVQGVDYAYTLQGWLKMINGNSLGEQYDMGQDGSYGTIYSPSSNNVHQKFAYDAYGFSLSYYNHGLAGGGAIAKDYSPVIPRTLNPLLDQSAFPFIDTPDPSEVGQDLYNGNISASTTTFYDLDPAHTATFGTPIPMASFYRYDQMNRLKKVQSYDHSNHLGTAWDPYTADDRYQMELRYDMNGNILNLKRNGNDAANLAMDNFNYNYFSLNINNAPQDIQLTGFNGDNTNLATNRLSKLDEDLNLEPNYDADIDGVNGTVSYEYDPLGNLTQDFSEEIQEIKWNAYGKVVEVLRTATCQDKPDLVYVYDAFGQRVKKIVKRRNAGVLVSEKDWQETYYLHDAQGNVMAMYRHSNSLNPYTNMVSESYTIEEWSLYGSSRLGVRKVDKLADVIVLASRNYTWINNTMTNEVIAPTTSIEYKKYRYLGAKTFELTNHLGNVIATISDRKLMVQDAQNIGYVHHYTPEILSIGEQYAFGMSMPGRTFSVENYRYGFNGKENQDELLGEDNAQDFGARMYDGRLGRWWGLDPNQNSYAHLSPYNAMENNPIYFNDPDGKDAIVTIVGNTIYIYAKIYIIGVGDLENLALEMETEINKVWGGHNNFKYKGYNVKFSVDVAPFDGQYNDGENVIFMTRDPNDPGFKGERYRSRVEDGRTGTWYVGLAPGYKYPHYRHEFGHIVGFKDGYIDSWITTPIHRDDDPPPQSFTYIKEDYRNNNIMAGEDGKVQQNLINLIGDHVTNAMKNMKGPTRSMTLKGGFLGFADTENDTKARKNEFKKNPNSGQKTPKSHKSSRGSSNKKSDKKGNGGHTRYKNPRFL
jgi:RHS repeat-associated protein